MADVDVVQLIDRTLEAVKPRCVQCRHLLGNSPSDDFCGYSCQQAWHNRRADAGPMPSAALKFDPALGVLREQLRQRLTVALEDQGARGVIHGDGRTMRQTPDGAMSPEAYHRAWARYPDDPPGLFESLWTLIRAAWRKR